MHIAARLIVLGVAVVTSAGLVAPTAGIAAEQWTTVRNDRYPLIEGSGRVVRQQRSVAPFSRIETVGSAIVEVRLGAARSLAIAADDNILPLLTSAVRGGTLTLGSRGSHRMRGPIRIWITAPDISGFRTAGSGQVMVQGVANDRLALTIDGSSSVRALGRTRALDLQIHGSGDADLANLAATDVTAGLYGSGDATVRVSGQLDARVIGSGDLRFAGHPAGVRQQKIGSGRISPVAR